MTQARQTARQLMLAGLDGHDLASAAHPYLHLAGLEEAAAQSAQRRARTARFTPGGLPQPPEVMGVDADARVPNLLQPMSGEFESGREVDSGKPAFFGPGMPPPTGLADGVGVTGHQNAGRLFGAPTGMVVRAPAVGADRFAWRPLAPASVQTLAALPHFANGGLVPPGQTGVVGEQGRELVKALPQGGAQVTPLRGAAMAAAESAPGGERPTGSVSATQAPGGAAPGLPTSPPEQEGEQQSYAASARRLADMRPPDPNDRALRTPAWKQALGIGLGALAAGLARRPDPGLGAAMYGETAPDLYAEAEQRYQANQRSQLAALAPLLSAAKLEQGQNAASTRAWQTQADDGLRQQLQTATAGYRALQLQNRQQAERERERQDQALDAARTSNQQALSDYRQQVLALRRQLQAAKNPSLDAQATQQALRNVLGAGTRAQAEQYLAKNRAALSARGANLDLLQRAIAQRWPGGGTTPAHP
jgi:hypothetical protein